MLCRLWSAVPWRILIVRHGLSVDKLHGAFLAFLTCSSEASWRLYIIEPGTGLGPSRKHSLSTFCRVHAKATFVNRGTCPIAVLCPAASLLFWSRKILFNDCMILYDYGRHLRSTVTETRPGIQVRQFVSKCMLLLSMSGCRNVPPLYIGHF